MTGDRGALEKGEDTVTIMMMMITRVVGRAHVLGTQRLFFVFVFALFMAAEDWIVDGDVSVTLQSPFAVIVGGFWACCSFPWHTHSSFIVLLSWLHSILVSNLFHLDHA